MGIGAVTPDTAGSVTAPTTFPLLLQSGQSIYRYTHDQPWKIVRLPGGRGLLGTNGTAHPSHVLASALYRTCPLAPETAPTVAVSSPGAKATATLTCASQPGDTSYIVLVSAGDEATYEWRVYFVTNFYTVEPYVRFWQVKRGAALTNSLDNLKAAINGTGTDGNEYRSPTIDAGMQTDDHPDSWASWVTAGTKTGTTLAFTTVQYGTGANNYEARHDGTAAYTSFGTSSKFTGGSYGAGTAPLAGDRSYAYAYKRTADGAMSGLSPVASVETTDAGNMDLSALAAPPSGLNESIDVKVWFRTQSGGETFFQGYDIAVADTTDTDDIDDDDIELNEEYDPLLHRSFGDGPLPRARVAAEYRGRVFLAGIRPAQEYTIGTCDVTAGSNAVTINSPGLPWQLWENRTFRVTTSALTEATTYRIVWVDESGGVVYLDRDYEGSTATGAAYAVRDTRDPFALYFSEPVLFNNYPPQNVITSIVSPNGEGVTAMVSAFESLVTFTRTGIWRLIGDDAESFRISNEYEGVGCVGPNAAVLAEGAVYFLADDGIYAWGGGGAPLKISAPPVSGGDARGIAGTVSRINRTYAHLAFGHYEPRKRILRWFVPLDANITNRHAIVYDLQTQTWGLDTASDICAVTTLVDPSGAQRTVAGDVYGNLWELDTSNSDGAFGFEPVNAISSSTRQTVTCSGASFPTTGDALKGVPVVFIDASGNFSYNTIASNTGTVLTLARIEATAPTGTAVVGGIHAVIESGRFTMSDPAQLKRFREAKVSFSPDVDGQYWLSYAFDQGDPTVASATTDGDLTQTTGMDRFWVRQHGRFFKFRIDAVEPGCDPAFIGLRLNFELMGAGRD